VNQIPVNNGDSTYDPLFASGAGLTYGSVTPPPTETPTPTPVGGTGGEVWFVPETSTVSLNDEFTVEIHANTGTRRLAAYGFEIAYDAAIISVNTDIGNSGVEAGADGYVAAVNPNKAGRLVVTGFDTAGTGPGSDLHVITINWRAEGIGTSSLHLTINNVADEATNDIPATASNGSVTVSDVTLGDVNDDGTIHIFNALLIAQYYVGLITSFC
jgi:hypothetical protein